MGSAAINCTVRQLAAGGVGDHEHGNELVVYGNRSEL
jgi:hypothetical protein